MSCRGGDGIRGDNTYVHTDVHMNVRHEIKGSHMVVWSDARDSPVVSPALAIPTMTDENTCSVKGS